MGKKVTDKDGVEFDLEALVESMIASKGGGDPTKALGLMVAENHELRGKNRDLRTENDQLKTNSNLPEGHVTLNRDEVSHWNAVKDLGKPEDITKKLTERDEFESKYTNLLTDQTVRDAASIAGYKHTVLGDLVRVKNMELTLGETEVADDKGNKVKQPTAFVKLANNQTKPLSEVITEQYSDYLPSLKIATDARQPAGTQWVPTGPTGGDGKANTPNAATQHINSHYGHLLEAPK